MRKILTALAVLLSATACIYPYDPDLGKAPEGVLVVEGDIAIGGTSTIQLSVMTSLDYPARWIHDNPGYTYADSMYGGGGGGFEPEVDSLTNLLMSANVWIEDSAGGTYTDPWHGRSTSWSIPTENAPLDREYRACIEVFDALYTSDWTKPLRGPEIKDIEFDALPYTVTVNVTLDGGPDATGYLLLSYDETWEFHADYPISYAVDPETWTILEMMTPDLSRYWCWKSESTPMATPIDFTAMGENGIVAYPLFSFARSDSRNHKKYSVLVKARTISRETYKYLRYLTDDTNGGGDLFKPDPGNMSGNLRCETDPGRMALGYVTTSQITSKRVYMDGRYYKRASISYGNVAFINETRYEEYFYGGYLPLLENPHSNYVELEEGPYGWGPPRCYDCVVAGGTKQKPDFWE